MSVPILIFVASWKCISEFNKAFINVHCSNFVCNMVTEVDKIVADFRCFFVLLQSKLCPLVGIYCCEL
jgi:hypothetical protein